METIIETIKEIEDMQKANEMLENNNTKKPEKYENSVEGELLQELDETKDFAKRRELIQKIKDIREEKLQKLNLELSEKVNNIKENMKIKEEKIEENKKTLYVMNENRNRFKNYNNSPEIKAVYDSITEQMSQIRQKNRELHLELEEIRKDIENIENKKFSELIQKYSKENIEERQEAEAPVTEEKEVAVEEQEAEAPVTEEKEVAVEEQEAEAPATEEKEPIISDEDLEKFMLSLENSIEKDSANTPVAKTSTNVLAKFRDKTKTFWNKIKSFFKTTYQKIAGAIQKNTKVKEETTTVNNKTEESKSWDLTPEEKKIVEQFRATIRQSRQDRQDKEQEK